MLWGLAVILCAVCAVVAVIDAPAFDLDIDLRVSSSPSQITVTASSPDTTRVNINTASTAELTALPGIGEVLAQRIVDYRERVGGFESVEQLKEVSGIGDAKFSAVKELVCIS